MPNDNVRATLAELTVDPALASTLEKIEIFASEKVQNWGETKHRIWWGPGVRGANEAVISDCQDQSEAGMFDIQGQKIITVGPKRTNVHGTYRRTEDGWKMVAYVTVESKC